MKLTQILSDEKFQDVYKNEKFRNEVAYSHKYVKNDEVFCITTSYPTVYRCSLKQKELALAEINRAKAEKMANIGNKLVFVGMGNTYEGDDIGNYRIRTYFKNKAEDKFSIELLGNLGRSKRDTFPGFCYVDHAIQHTIAGREKVEIRNYAEIEQRSFEYSKESILKVVNNNFKCAFTVLEIDNYTLCCEEFTCQSP